MSIVKNQDFQSWKDVEQLLSRRAPVLYNSSTPLTEASRTIVRDAYMLWFLSTWDTLSLSEYPLTKGTTNRWIDSICSVPVRDLVDLLKDGSHQLVAGDFSSYDTFKQYLSISHSHVGAILAPIKREIDRWFSETDTDALDLCYSWFLFISRLNLPGLASLEKDALDNYLLIESEILDDGFTVEESKILEDWFPRSLDDMVFLTENHSPEHGPGATADAGRILQQKYASLSSDPRIAMLTRRVYADTAPYPRPDPKGLVRRSSTIFVPKSLGSYRTISMEPATIMWHQKGVRNALTKLIRKRHHYLSRRFRPEDQQPNRDLAWLGSIDGSFSTIDLSSASDTVSWALVKRWFHNTSLYPWLLWTRSTHTKLPDGTEIKLKKFAPMGSDLCFPIETIIFVAIVECSILECGGDPMTSSYRVYGDDIVVEEEYATTVYRRLRQNGFILNENKTFSGSQPHGFFRESCGGFFFNGAEITPVRLSRWFSGYSQLGCDTPGRIESLIELANDCSSRFPSVRRWCVKVLLDLPRQLRPPFSSDGSFGLFSLQPTNYHLFVKESKSLQCNVHTYGVSIVPKRQRRLLWEDIRFYEYLRRVDKRQRLTWPEDLVIVDVSPVPSPSWSSRIGVIR